MCTWASTNPGRMVLPSVLMTRALAGYETWPLEPTALIRDLDTIPRRDGRSAGPRRSAFHRQRVCLEPEPGETRTRDQDIQPTDVSSASPRSINFDELIAVQISTRERAGGAGEPARFLESVIRTDYHRRDCEDRGVIVSLPWAVAVSMTNRAKRWA